MVTSIPVQEAVGKVLFHDITKIVPGEFKGRAFKKGHIIQDEDIPKLLSLGKDNIYVLDLKDEYIHENDAAIRIAQAAAGPGITLREPSEGKVTMVAAVDGLLKVKSEALLQVNSVDQIVLASLHGNRPVVTGTPVAGTRIIPLFTENERVREVESLCENYQHILEIRPFQSLKVGLVTTGNEIFHGRIADKFGPILSEKLSALGSSVFRQIITPDDPSQIVGALKELLADGAQMIVASGGMSVDPDDRTPSSIRALGGEVVAYGAPTFPGSMFMLSYAGGVPIIGVPGCAMYHKATIFELIVPRILAGDRVTRADIVALGYGGFCAGCAQCHYPVCSFGKV
jgi:molybdenum cofactor synthesis domain-containing protein